MSIDFAGGTTPVLDVPVFPYVGQPVVTEAKGGDLTEALAQMTVESKDGTAVLLADADVKNGAADDQTALTEESAEPQLIIDLGLIFENASVGAATAASSDSVVEFDEDVGPTYILYEPERPDDGGSGGYIDVYEPTINVPEGFAPEHHYATEFILDVTTGVFTIHLYFSTDPLDYQMAGSLDSPVDGVGQQAFDLGFGDVLPLNAGNGSKCTVTITRTTTQNSPTSSFSFKSGVVNYTHNSGGSSTTTTRSYSYEGILKNGRCVATNAR